MGLIITVLVVFWLAAAGFAWALCITAGRADKRLGYK